MPEVIVTKRSTLILSVSRWDTVDAANESLISEATEMGKYPPAPPRKKKKEKKAPSKARLCYFCCWCCCLHHRKKEIERETKGKEVGTHHPFDLPFLLNWSASQKAFWTQRYIAFACGAIFMHDCENTNTLHFVLFFWANVFCMLRVCPVLRMNVKSGTSLFAVVLNWLFSCLSWLPFSLHL